MRRFIFERLVLRALWYLLWASPGGSYWYRSWRDEAIRYLDDEAEQQAVDMAEWEAMKQQTREDFQK